MFVFPKITRLTFETFGIEWYIFTYFIMTVLGLLAGMTVILIEGHRRKLDTKHIIWAGIFGYGLAYIGTRFFFYFMPWWSWHRDWTLSYRIWRFFNFSKPGLVFYGGLVFGILGLWLYFKFKKKNFWKYADAFIVGLPMGMIFGRIGCFLTNDTCRGESTDFFISVIRTEAQGPIHPAPVYSSILMLILFIFLWKLRKKETFDGWLGLVGLMGYSVIRFFIEFIRNYEYEIFGFITPSHYMSVIVFGVALWIYLKKKKEWESRENGKDHNDEQHKKTTS